MKLSAKEVLMIVISIALGGILSYFLGLTEINLESFEIIILLIVVVSAIFFVVYKRINELGDEIDKISEKLKTKEELDILKLDIEKINWILKDGKKK